MRALQWALVALFIVACAVTTPAPIDAPGPIVAVSETPVSWGLFESWAPEALATLTAHFELDTPPELVVRYDAPPVNWDEFGRPTSWYRGLWFSGTIWVWVRTPLGDPPLEELQTVLIHEFLHHLDWCRGIEGPDGPHNAEYEQRIQKLGLRKLVGAKGL